MYSKWIQRVLVTMLIITTPKAGIRWGDSEGKAAEMNATSRSVMMRYYYTVPKNHQLKLETETEILKELKYKYNNKMYIVNLILACNSKRLLHNSATIKTVGREFHNSKRLVKKGMEKLAPKPSKKMNVLVSTETRINNQWKPATWVISKEERRERRYKSWTIKKKEE